MISHIHRGVVVHQSLGRCHVPILDERFPTEAEAHAAIDEAIAEARDVRAELESARYRDFVTDRGRDV